MERINEAQKEKTQARCPAKNPAWVRMQKPKSVNHSTILDDDKARYLRGIELYQSGLVEIGKDGLFYCNGYRVSPDNRISCECKDFQFRSRPCKHLYAVWQFQKNGFPRDSLLWFN
jgi:hypothetical protein